MKYKLFISDFDGTLGKEPDIISDENIKAIKEYEKKGGIFCIVTGRSFESINAICEKYGIKSVVGAFQGSKIVDLKTGEILFHAGLSPAVANDVVKRLKNDKIVSCVWKDECLYYEELSYYVDLYIKGAGRICKQTDDLSKLILSNDCVVDKVIALDNNENIDNDIKVYNKLFGDKVLVNSGADYLLEFVNPSYHKGFAVEFLSKHYNIPLSEVIAVGDSLNDKALMDDRWHGVCVANGSEELKKSAKEITVSFKDNAIKYLLDKYCL